MRPFSILGAFAVLVLAIGPADAQLPIGPFPIDGLQEVPPVVTPGIGTGMVTLQPSGMLDFDINFSGLLAPEIAAHFHGAAPAGMTAPPIFTLPPGSPKIGSVGPLNIIQQAELLSGLWYVNIHSSLHPGGEIRGQVVPEPGTLGLFALGGLALLRRR